MDDGAARHNMDNSSGELSDATNVVKTEKEHDARNHSVAYSRRGSVTAAEKARRNVNAKLANPLAGYSHAELEEQGTAYAQKYLAGDADEEDIRAFAKGAVLAQDPSKYDMIHGTTPQEIEILKKEFTNRWSQPWRMYLVIILCSVCAAVQGMGKSETPSLRAGAAYSSPSLTMPQMRRWSTVLRSSTPFNLASPAQALAPLG